MTFLNLRCSPAIYSSCAVVTLYFVHSCPHPLIYSFCSVRYLISAVRLRHLRQQAVITRSMLDLFRRVSERHVDIIVAEFTGSQCTDRHVRQFLHLIHLLQRWFMTRHLY